MAHNFKQAVPTFWCREGLELVGQTQCTSEVFQVSDIENAVFQSQGMEALQMLIGGFVIFMIPQVVGSVIVLLELAAVMLRQAWYI